MVRKDHFKPDSKHEHIFGGIMYYFGQKLHDNINNSQFEGILFRFIEKKNNQYQH